MARTKANIGTINCRGPEGNIFYILGKAREALRKERCITWANEMIDRVHKSTSYEEAKSIIAEYVEVKYVD